MSHSRRVRACAAASRPWGRFVGGGVLVALLAAWAAIAQPPAGETMSPAGEETPQQAEEPAAPMAVSPEHAEEMAESLELFRNHVREILVDNCVHCHAGPEAEAELDLSTREGLLRGSWSGELFAPGDGDYSILMMVLRHEMDPYMPMEAPKLSDEELAHFQAWLESGAAYDGPLVDAEEAAIPWTERTLEAADREWWSFQPLATPALPQVENAAWCNNAIDRFVLARLEEAGLAPNPRADRRTLIRRATYDLTGLPPTAAEVEAFLADDSPDAYERLIDRLLASPAYGERWGRHWLDVARFGESHGYEHDYDRPTAYPYRDFVIQALNDDMPYNQFLAWQIAGDELAPENPLAMMATGFLGAGVHNTQITANEVEKERYNDLDDMGATVGTAMLGLTIGCARCHDHKFDPIPQADYYRFISTFTTAVRGEVDLALEDLHYDEARAIHVAELSQLKLALAEYEAHEMPANLLAWEQDPARQIESPWQILRPTEYGAENGTTLTLLEDDSLLAAGPNPLVQNYHFIFQTDLARVTGIRIEALADDSLPHGGPGRAGNGNFALSNLQLQARPLLGGEQNRDLTLAEAQATFEQSGLPAAAAIDADNSSAWSVSPEFNTDHAAVFAVAEPLDCEGGTVLTLTLAFNNNNEHALGRLRISATGEATLPEPSVAAITPLITRILQLAPADRTAAQQATLLEWFRTIDPQWEQLHQAVLAHEHAAPAPPIQRALVVSEGIEPIRLHTQGADFYEECFYLKRGDPNQKQGVAPAGFLQAITPLAEQQGQWAITPPPGDPKSYRRAALTGWMTDVEQGAGSLTARVGANRLWHWHLGRGIVATPSDFGRQGVAPTHPELLDWLASEMVAGDWQLKRMHRLIMTSATYQQSSAIDEEKLAADDANLLLWRWNVRRLEAEAIRDSMLSVSGGLDRRMYGAGTLAEGMPRRSVYFTVKRSQLIPVLQLFDWPDALGSQGQRQSTTVAPQALTFMNNGHVRDYARAFAARVSPTADTPPAEALAAAWNIALGRAPSEAELAAGLTFLERQQTAYAAEGHDNPREMALADLCQTLFCLNEFVYLD